MSTRLKELSEKRGAKLKEASALIAKATEEKRELTSAEQETIAKLHTDAEAINGTIMIEARQLAIESQKAPQLSRQEARDIATFDLGKVLRRMRDALDGSQSFALDGIESEILKEGRNEAQQAGVLHRGVMLPRMIVRRTGYEARDMTATGTTSVAGDQGGMTIATEKRGLLDDFYNALVIRQAGALVMEGLQGNVDMPRYVKPTAPAGKAENGSADELSPTTAMISLQPKRLPAFIDLSDRLLIQSSAAIEAVVRKNLTQQLGDVMEIAFINGAQSSATEAAGILTTSGIGAVAGGTNGAVPTWGNIVDLESAVANANAASGALHYLTNTKVRGKLKQTVRVASTDSRFIWDGEDLNGYAPLVSNAVPSTLTKGSSSGICSAIIFGNFNDYAIGFWAGLSLELIRDSANAKVGMHTLVANSYYDGAVLRPASFAAMKDALTT
jgi:HK97 family phage major capsid protein